MTEKEALRLKDKGFKKAKALRIHGEAEDIGQHVVAEMLQNGRGQTVDQCVIDYYRKNYGRRRAKNFDARQRLRKAVSVDKEIENLKCQNISPIDAIQFQQRLKRLKPYKRAIIALHFAWGMTGTEIADCFGLTEEAIYSQLRTILARMLFD